MRRQINSDELNYLYTKLGQAVWHLQYVEDALVPLILIKGVAKKINSIERNVALDHEGKLRKLTLGKLIGKAQELDALNETLLNRLRNFNNERKWLVHNSIFESGNDLYTFDGRNQLFQRIECFIVEAQLLHKYIGEDIIEYSVGLGIPREKIYGIATNKIKKLKGEV